MHILRWLFVHPVIFAWVLAILAILLNYGIGGSTKEDAHSADSGEMAEQHAEAAAASNEGETESASATEVVAAEGEKAAEQEVAAEIASAEEPAPQVEADQVAQDAAGDAKAVAVTTAAAAVATAAATASGDSKAAAEQPAETEQAATSEAQAEQAVATSEEAAQAPEAAVAQAENTGSQAAPAETSNDDLLVAAREAYWSDDFGRAAEFYLALLERDNQPSYKGELANVYWKQGNSQEAVKLYADIAVWLKDQGRMAELQNIKVYVDLVDPAVGEKIGELMK
ncbi:MAG: hypothetical protein R3F02_12235 [Thiolinea sp.]